MKLSVLNESIRALVLIPLIADAHSQHQRSEAALRMTTYKLEVVGGPYTGKSDLVIMFIQSVFYANYEPTIDDSYRKPCIIDGKVCILDLLDTASVEEYHA